MRIRICPLLHAALALELFAGCQPAPGIDAAEPEPRPNNPVQRASHGEGPALSGLLPHFEDRASRQWRNVAAVDGEACRAALREVGVRFRSLPDHEAPNARGCGMPHGVVVTRGPTGIAYVGGVQIDCSFALALPEIERIVQEEARAHLGQPIRRIRTFGGYNCRPVRGRRERLSEHAFGNAFDVARFEPKRGRAAIVARDYPLGPNAKVSPQGEFLRAVYRRLRTEIKGVHVRGPESDALHRDHFHVDRGARWWVWWCGVVCPATSYSSSFSSRTVVSGLRCRMPVPLPEFRVKRLDLQGAGRGRFRAVKFFYSAPTFIITTALLVIAGITGLAQVLTSRLVRTAHEGDYELMRNAFSNTLKAMEDEATSDAEIVASIPSVRKAFLARDRATLEAETLGMFRTIEPKYEIDQAQFHIPPGISFLRLHAPEKFGDDQTAYRPMLSEVHHEKAIRKGTAITKGGPAIFGIVPIFDDKGEFAGSFEMGLEFGPVLKELKTAYAIEGAVFFEEKQLREVATDIEPDIITPKNRVGKYIRYYATHPDLMAAIVTDRDVEITEAKRFERTVARVPWGVQLVPLYNYANKQIGVVALATSFEEDKTLARRSLVWQLLAAVFAIVILAGVVLISIRGLLLRPLAALTDRMSALAAGDASRPADPLGDYCDELRKLASSYEELRGQKQT